MMNQLGYTALVSSITLLGICYLLFWRYRIYQLDHFREEMFILRDSLFNEARDGLIDFNHPAYGTLRMTMNGHIRFGHRLSFWQLVYLALAINHSEVDDNRFSFKASWDKVTANLDEATKERLDYYRGRMTILVIKHVLFSVPECFVAVPFVILLVLFFLIRDIARSPSRLLLGKVENKFEDLEDAALAYGS